MSHHPHFEAGQVIGDVEILSGILLDHPHYHRCRCRICGNESLMTGNMIRDGATGGCGDCRKRARAEAALEAVREEMIGQRFGALVVKDVIRAKRYGCNLSTCVCVCDCGRTTEIPRNRIVMGGATSCGHDTGRNLRVGRAISRAETVTGTKIASLSQRVSKNSKTGVKGVCAAKRGGYRAYINFRRKQYGLGEYDTLEAAAKARARAEERIYGDFLAWYAENYPDHEAVKVAAESESKMEEKND